MVVDMIWVYKDKIHKYPVLRYWGKNISLTWPGVFRKKNQFTQLGFK